VRSDSVDFAAANTAVDRRPRYVVQIIFSDSSPSFTSHAGIADVPGDVYAATVSRISSISQQVWPEEGRTTIGSVTVELLETAGNGITQELRDQLTTLDPADAESARGKEMRIYVGFSDDFNDYGLVNTFFVSDVAYANGAYVVQAKDKTRELRTTILEPKETVITAAVSSSATTITVSDTTDFEMVPHGASFQDAPSSTVGYAKLEDTGEIFRYTGKTATTFTGVTRGVFGTKAQEVPFNPSDSRDAWPKVVEVIYLELPGPLAIVAVLTGVLDTAVPVVELPDHWHMGLSYSLDLQALTFTQIGADLYDPANLTVGFPVRFIDPGASNGKTFVEKELCQLLGLYMVARNNGRLALRRINRVLPESGFVAILDQQNVVSHGDLRHDYNALLNQFRVDYNWNGDEFTRSILIVDSASVTTHGAGDQKQLEFKGLHTARHTERAIRERIGVLRDRYAAPPLRLPVTCDATTNAIDIGDVVDVRLPGVQDYTQDFSYLRRVFEVQRVSVDWVSGNVEFDLFASTTPPAEEGSNDDTSPALGDSWYTGSGTNMSSLTGYVAAGGGSPARLTANVTLTGSASDVRASGSIWYHSGDLTIDSGVVVTVVNQAQFRIKGFLQVNGKIDGKGRGAAGGSDTDTVGGASTALSRPGTAGFLGPTRSGDGIWIYSYGVYPKDQLLNSPGTLTLGMAGGTSAPRLALDVQGGSLVSGLPTILVGTSGPSGGQVVQGSGKTVKSRGGNGGASGAGLALICRGLGYGPSGVIDLSGNDGAAPISSGVYPDATAYDDHEISDCLAYSGGGGGGYPGAFYCLLDGDGQPYPDINSATFIANRGNTTLTGVSAGATYPLRGVVELRYPNDTPNASNITGRNEYWQGAAANMWTVAHQVQYLPSPPAAQEKPITPPASLTATGGLGQNTLRWNWPIGQEVADVEVYASSSNDRAFASLLAEVVGGSFSHSLPVGGTRYYWIRSRGKLPDQRASAWYPSGATSGVSATASSAESTQNPLTIRANKSTYTTTTSGNVYLHGFDTLGNPVDGPAEVNHNGGIVAVSAGTLATSQNVDEGWIIFETSGATPFTVGGVAKPYACARKSRAGWVYDNGTTWTTFTATSTMVVVGTYARSGGSITSVVALGNAMTLSVVPYENATQVVSGDIQSGAISDLAAFASTIRPVNIVSSLPSLPDTTNYPDGSLVLLTSDHKVYRADYGPSPEVWVKTVDGADVIAGTISAASLAADLVLATLFRTAGSGTRVEIEGNGHVFPFWIGSGAKGTVTGSPGSGAKAYYDKTADELGITGKLVASHFSPDDDGATYVESTGGYSCAGATFIQGGSFQAGISSDSTFTNGGESGNVTLLHPETPSISTDTQRRLATAQTPFQILFFCAGRNTAGSEAITVKLQYSYNNGSSYSDADTFYFNLSTQLASRLGVYRFKSSFASSDSPRFRLAVKNQSAGATNYVGLTYFIFVNNLTRVGDQFTTLT